MSKKTLKSLPVIMHHLVSNDTSQLSVVPAIFEEQCRMLAEKGWFGVSLEQAENFLLYGEPLPKKSFLMTFDDGYLDNYIYAYPIMRKYGHKGVVFATANRITDASQNATGKEGEKVLRPTIEDVWKGTCLYEDLPPIDNLTYTNEFGFKERRDLFFSWDEARAMEASGVMAVAGHSVTHGSVFRNADFHGFIKPGDRLYTFIHTTPSLFYGCPSFNAVPELAHRGFIPSEEMFASIKNLVPQDTASAIDFFSNAQNVTKLEQLVESYKDNFGAFESDDAMKERMAAIMKTSQEVLSRELGHPIRSFCWPFGPFCQEAREQGLSAGFEVFYTTKIGINRPGSAQEVSRFKVKNRADSWLPGRIQLYSNPLLGGLYLKFRI